MNLDGIDSDELWALHNRLRQHLVAEARKKGSPPKPIHPHGIVANITIRQSFLEPCYAFTGYLGVAQTQGVQLRESLQMR